MGEEGEFLERKIYVENKMKRRNVDEAQLLGGRVWPCNKGDRATIASRRCAPGRPFLDFPCGSSTGIPRIKGSGVSWLAMQNERSYAYSKYPVTASSVFGKLQIHIIHLSQSHLTGRSFALCVASWGWSLMQITSVIVSR